MTLPHLGVARDGDEVALLMPDLADVLIRWEQPIDVATLERVLDALAALHREPWQRAAARRRSRGPIARAGCSC